MIHVRQQRAGDEVIALNGNVAAERFLEHVGDGDALPGTGVEMLDKCHVDVAREQRELDRAKLVESPALAAAPRGDGFAPDRGHFFAQRFVLDSLQAGKELRDLSDAIVASFGRRHGVTSVSDGIFEASREFVLLFSWLPNRV